MIDEAPPLPPGPAPLTGSGLEVVQPIGRVGDGLVYAGRDRGVAARLREYAPAGIVSRRIDGALHPVEDTYADVLSEAVDRFVDQGNRLAGFSHPGIAPVWRTEVATSGTAWLIGGPAGAPLREMLDAGAVFTPADIVRFAGELADVLAELHGRGLTHLDIAPETLSIASGQVQLADFAVDNRPVIALLHGHEGLVRPGYSPIEHYDAGMEEPLGPPADVYAASALVYRLVSGNEPPPWQNRWRNADAAALPDREDYPPGFLAGIRKGTAIEPGDRFADGAAWRAALNLPLRIIRHVPVLVEAEPEPRRGALPIILAGAALLIVALLGILAWQLHWFSADGTITNTGNIQVNGGDNRQQPPLEPVPTAIRAGNTAEGQLGPGDAIGPSGGLRDQYRLDGHRGDRLEIRVRATGFVPTLSLFGPGLAGQQGENGRLIILLPQDGAYIIQVGADRPGAAGSYQLQVVPAVDEGSEPGPVDPAAARRIAGTWHDEDDDSCELPAVNSVQGQSLVVILRDETFRHRIDAASGNEVDTTVEGGRLDGRTFHFRVSPDGDSYDMDGEAWTRC